MSLRTSFMLSFLEKYSSLVITFISSIVIARLLSPEEIGIYSVTVAFTTLAHMLRDFGVGDYLIKEKNLTKNKVGTVLGVAMIFAWSVGGILILISGYIAEFYNEPGIKNVLHILSISFFIIPFSSPILPLLRRKMAYDKLLRINLSSNFVHAIVAMSLAYLGFSYMSLAWSSLAAVLTTFLLAQIYRPIEAKVLPCLSEYKEILTFGSTVSVGMLVTELGRNSTELIIGKVMDFTSVGLYGRAQGLAKMVQGPFFSAIQPVFQSDFAEKIRKGESIYGIYLKGIDYTTVIAWPFFGFVGIFSEDIITILFGSQWSQSAPMASILCMAAVIWTLSGLASKALIAGGHAIIILKIQSIVQGSRLVLTVIGSFYSLQHIAFMFCLVMVISFFIHSYYLKTIFDITKKDILKKIMKSAFVSITCYAVSVILLIIFNDYESSILLILLFLCFFVLTWITSIFVFDHAIKNEITSTAEKIINSFRKQ